MSKPIAWLHREHPTAYIITARVKEIWEAVNPKMVENYTIPLYTMKLSEVIVSLEGSAIEFASDVFALLPYRRIHSLSRDIWHEVEESDGVGRRVVVFLSARELLEQHPDHPTWFRFKDPSKRAVPPEQRF